jgi:nucleoside 2-deoxyribosyltransferase
VLVYTAGPLFPEAERRLNLGLVERLESLGFRVFIPQRDGVERDNPPQVLDLPRPRRGLQ